MEETKQTTAEGLRALADWYEAHPEIDVPSVVISIWERNGGAAKKLALTAKAMGTCEKSMDDYSITLKRHFGPVMLLASISRDAVCRKIVTYDCPKSLLETLGPEFEQELASHA